MSLYLIFSIITVFLALAFALLHLMVSLSELKRARRPLEFTYFFLGSGLATFSLILYFLLPIVATISLADWLWVDLLRSLLEWQAQRKLQSSPPCHSDRNCSDSYHFISPYLRKTQVLSMKT